jgi:hypothetical protein
MGLEGHALYDLTSVGHGICIRLLDFSARSRLSNRMIQDSNGFILVSLVALGGWFYAKSREADMDRSMLSTVRRQ